MIRSYTYKTMYVKVISRPTCVIGYQMILKWIWCLYLFSSHLWVRQLLLYIPFTTIYVDVRSSLYMQLNDLHTLLSCKRCLLTFTFKTNTNISIKKVHWEHIMTNRFCRDSSVPSPTLMNTSSIVVTDTPNVLIRNEDLCSV